MSMVSYSILSKKFLISFLKSNLMIILKKYSIFLIKKKHPYRETIKLPIMEYIPDNSYT